MLFSALVKGIYYSNSENPLFHHYTLQPKFVVQNYSKARHNVARLKIEIEKQIRLKKLLLVRS